MNIKTGFGLLAPVLLALATGTPAFAQSEPATDFFNFICEIDVSVLGTDFALDDGTTSVFTFDSRRACAGSASTRNAKIDCEDTIPGWDQGQQSASGFACTINGDTCGLAPLLTTTDSNLTVSPGGAAKLTCFYHP
jgi:hypothetical protein